MVKNIVLKSKEIISAYRHFLMPLFLLMLVLESFKSMGLQLGILGIFLLLGLIASEHAEVVVGLKLTHQKDEPLAIPQDALCGVTRFKELFSTYFWMAIVEMGILALLFLLLRGLAFNADTALFWQETLRTIENELQYGISSTIENVIAWGTLIFVGIDLIVGYVVRCLYFLAPYYLEIKGISGFAALRLAFKNSKGHWKDIFLLQGRYYIIIVFFSCLNYLVNMYISSLLLSVVFVVVLFNLEIYFCRMEYVVAKALLYKEISQE